MSRHLPALKPRAILRALNKAGRVRSQALFSQRISYLPPKCHFIPSPARYTQLENGRLIGFVCSNCANGANPEGCTILHNRFVCSSSKTERLGSGDSPSPDHGHSVARENHVLAHERQPFGERLRNQDTVERVLVEVG
jgi:hypothetical protein